jgi:hypothetical protein
LTVPSSPFDCRSPQQSSVAFLSPTCCLASDLHNFFEQLHVFFGKHHARFHRPNDASASVWRGRDGYLNTVQMQPETRNSFGTPSGQGTFANALCDPYSLVDGVIPVVTVNINGFFIVHRDKEAVSPALGNSCVAQETSCFAKHECDQADGFYE